VEPLYRREVSRPSSQLSRPRTNDVFLRRQLLRERDWQLSHSPRVRLVWRTQDTWRERCSRHCRQSVDSVASCLPRFRGAQPTGAPQRRPLQVLKVDTCFSYLTTLHRGDRISLKGSGQRLCHLWRISRLKKYAKSRHRNESVAPIAPPFDAKGTISPVLELRRLLLIECTAWMSRTAACSTAGKCGEPYDI